MINIPRLNSLIILTSATVYTLSFLIPGLLVALCNIPQKTLFQFELYRLFTAPFVHKDVLNLLIDLFILIPSLSLMERQVGCKALFYDLLKNTLVIQGSYCVLMALLSLLLESALLLPTFGLLPLALFYLTLHCLANPEQFSTVCCAPVQNKYIPVLILVVLNLLQFQPAILIAGLYGYYQSPSTKEMVGGCLASVCCASVSRDYNSCFGTSQSSLPVRSQPSNQAINNPPARLQPVQPPVQSFQGRGVSIGGGPP